MYPELPLTIWVISQKADCSGCPNPAVMNTLNSAVLISVCTAWGLGPSSTVTVIVASPVPDVWDKFTQLLYPGE